jgi:PhnB protein
MASINPHINFKGNAEEMPMTESPDGSCFAMFRDKFGIEWMIKFDPV